MLHNNRMQPDASKAAPLMRGVMKRDLAYKQGLRFRECAN
jgi:hypothetical protein